MVSSMKTLDERIKEKEAEIEHHAGVLIRQRHSRWYDQSCRYMASLKVELAELIAERDRPPNALMGELVDPQD